MTRAPERQLLAAALQGEVDLRRHRSEGHDSVAREAEVAVRGQIAGEANDRTVGDPQQGVQGPKRRTVDVPDSRSPGGREAGHRDVEIGDAEREVALLRLARRRVMVDDEQPVELVAVEDGPVQASGEDASPI